jgi:hypothetical protein
MRVLPFVTLVVACTRPTPPLEPSAKWMSLIDCHFDHNRPKELSLDGKQGQLALTCSANNLTDVGIEACATAYIGVYATGTVYATHAPVCFELAPKDSSLQVIGSSVPREACWEARGGCAVRTFTLDNEQPPVMDVLAFAEDIENHAHTKVSLQPSVRECLDLVKVWQRRPEFAHVRAALASASEAVLACRVMPRVDYECLRAARDDRDIVACAPHR